MATDIPQASGWRAIVERLGNILFLAPLLRALLARLTVFVAAELTPEKAAAETAERAA